MRKAPFQTRLQLCMKHKNNVCLYPFVLYIDTKSPVNAFLFWKCLYMKFPNNRVINVHAKNTSFLWLYSIDCDANPALSSDVDYLFIFKSFSFKAIKSVLACSD